MSRLHQAHALKEAAGQHGTCIPCRRLSAPHALPFSVFRRGLTGAFLVTRTSHKCGYCGSSQRRRSVAFRGRCHGGGGHVCQPQP